eukprot:GILI01003349.1.p1 GENE.GILI01003349.1~~GILI01003349.1.p1  ORF type:complete len:245 (-),score=75.51 GILI01003349.1:374-1009(-)
MGGQIAVRSVYGKGSTFSFTVNLLESDKSCEVCFPPQPSSSVPPAASSLSIPISAAGGDGESSRKKRILVVDDTEFNVFVVQAYLGDTVDIQVARNGQQALEMVRESLLGCGGKKGEKFGEKKGEDSRVMFDLVLMDCEMPLMNGFEATAAIRSLEQEYGLKRMPIIGLTALAMSGDKEKCLHSGMDDYMTKPISKLLLTSTLRNWLKTLS